jgi:uncharacterized protein
MKREFTPERLDVAAFAEAGGQLAGRHSLGQFARLAAEAVETTETEAGTVDWRATGEQRHDAAGRAEPWLHLHAQAALPLVCQRCLTPVRTDLEVDRWFRFAPDEDTAAALDEESDEDVLVLSREFDLPGLVEDELLMALPITPRHDVCPQDVPLSVADPDFEAAGNERPNPFAALAKLKPGKPPQ